MALTIRELLCLDHFYINTREKEFRSLIGLADALGARHSKSGTPDEQWEGLYGYSRTGSYFEILRESHYNGFGIGFSAHPQLDTSIIQDEFPQWTWSETMQKDQDGKNWFKWYAPTIESAGGFKFFPWIMQFQGQCRPRRTSFPRSIDSIRRVEIDIPHARAELLDELTSWFPGARHRDTQQLVLDVPDRDFHPMTLILNLVNTDGVTFRSMSVRMFEEHSIEKTIEVDGFSLSVEDAHTYVLSKRG